MITVTPKCRKHKKQSAILEEMLNYQCQMLWPIEWMSKERLAEIYKPNLIRHSIIEAAERAETRNRLNHWIDKNRVRVR